MTENQENWEQSQVRRPKRRKTPQGDPRNPGQPDDERDSNPGDGRPPIYDPKRPKP